MIHGGADNGKLVVTYDQFEAQGIARRSIAPALRECVALGFVEITRQGGLSYGGARVPSAYRLTYVSGTKKSPTPTHEWRRFKTRDEALKARRETHSSGAEPHPGSGAKSDPTNRAFPGPKVTLHA